MDIDGLLTQKREKVTAANEIRDRVYNDQNGEWRGDDTEKFDGLMADVERISNDVERLAKLESAARSLERANDEGERRTAPKLSDVQRRGGAPAATKEDRALVLHGWFANQNLESSDLVTDRHREAAQRCGVSLDQPRLRLRLPAEAIRATGFNGDSRIITREDVADWEQRLTQVDVVSPDLGGHFTVPDEMMRPLEVAMLRFGGMRQVATIIRTATGADLPIPTLNDTTNSGALLGEGLEHTEDDLTFLQLVLNAFKYTSKRVPVSVEYLQDNAIGFVGRIGEILGQRIGRITNTHFTTGDGNSKPRGIVTAAADSTVTAASGTAVTYDELIDLKHSVDPDYRDQGAQFMFRDSMLAVIKKLKVPQFSGDTAGQPLWRAGMSASEPNTIDGDRYIVNQQMPAPTTGQKAILYGLLSKYQIRDVRDITLVRLDERYAELGVVAFLAFSRHDGDLLDAGTNPVKYLTMG